MCFTARIGKVLQSLQLLALDLEFAISIVFEDCCMRLLFRYSLSNTFFRLWIKVTGCFCNIVGGLVLLFESGSEQQQRKKIEVVECGSDTEHGGNGGEDEIGLF